MLGETGTPENGMLGPPDFFSLMRYREVIKLNGAVEPKRHVHAGAISFFTSADINSVAKINLNFISKD